MTVVSALLGFGLLVALLAETVVGCAFLHQFEGVLLVDVLALALGVGTVVTSDIRTFVMDEAGCAEGVVYDVDGAFYVAALVRVLDAEDEFSVLGFCKQICKERRAQVPDVHIACGTGRKTCWEKEEVVDRGIEPLLQD